MNNKFTLALICIGVLISFGIGYCIGGNHPSQDSLDREYNRGYGDALYWSLQQQQHEYTKIWYNTTFNHDTIPNFTNCTQNETGYNPDDLVMHMTCDDDTKMGE